MKKWLFFVLCIMANAYASDKKDSSSGSVDLIKRDDFAPGQAQDKKQMREGEFRAYNPKPIFTSSESCNVVRFLPNGKTIATDSGKGGLSLYTIANRGVCHVSAGGGIIQSLDCYGQSLSAAAESNGMISQSKGMITLWDPIYTQQAQWQGKTTKISSIRFDREGKRLAVGSFQDGKALYSVETQQELFSECSNGKTNYVSDIQWLHDNSTLAVFNPYNRSGKVYIWDTRDNKVAAEMSTYHSGAFGNSQLVCTADETIIWTDYQVLRAWDRKTSKTRDMAVIPISYRTGRSLNYYTSLALGHDDTTLAALLLCNQCDFIDWHTGKRLQTLPIDTDFNHCVAFSPQSDKVAITSIDQQLGSPRMSGIRVYEKEKSKEE